MSLSLPPIRQQQPQSEHGANEQWKMPFSVSATGRGVRNAGVLAFRPKSWAVNYQKRKSGRRQNQSQGARVQNGL